MIQVDAADLEMSIYIQLRVLRGSTRTNLQRVGSDVACKTAARLIIERCLSGCAIFKPSPFYKFETAGMGRGDGYVQHNGRFGVSEAWPRPPVAPPQLDRCRLCTVNDLDGLGEELAKAMWTALVSDRAFEDAEDDRSSFLLIAHRAINWLGRSHAEHPPRD
jgi:hypothetical protein